ncbi:UNVERIFIED_CONTAM: hypothetical protein FKN15_000216 [Acipenser sinensis]
MSRPSSAGGGGGGLGAGKAGSGKHAAGAGSVTPAAAASLPTAVLPCQAAELTALFECPVCFDYVLPPILQCQAGHLVCNQCRQKLSCCPTCRGPLTPSIRNLAMEKVASTLPFPCKCIQFARSLVESCRSIPRSPDLLSGGIVDERADSEPWLSY